MGLVFGAILIVAVAFGTASAKWADRRAADERIAAAAAPTIGQAEMSRTVTADVDGVLLPGGTADLIVVVRNDSTTPLTVLAVVQAGGASVARRGECASTAGLMTVLPTQEIGVRVPARTTRTVRVAKAAFLSRQANLECSGIEFHVPVALTLAG